MRGRTPKPPMLKMMLGNPSKQRTNYAEPVPATNIGAPSEWLTDEQKAVWVCLLANAHVGQLKELDRAALEVFVCANDSRRRAAKKLAKQRNPLSKTAQQLQTIVDRQARVMRQYAVELGFTPASRPRIQFTPEPDAGKSEFEKLMG